MGVRQQAEAEGVREQRRRGSGDWGNWGEAPALLACASSLLCLRPTTAPVKGGLEFPPKAFFGECDGPLNLRQQKQKEMIQTSEAYY